MPASEIQGSPDAQAFISQLTSQSVASFVLTLALLVLAAGIVVRERTRGDNCISQARSWACVFVSLSVLLVAGTFRALAP